LDIIRVLSLVVIAVGFAMALGSKLIVGKFGLDKNIACEFEHEMNEAELREYKFTKAVVNFKMWGMAVALPGIVLFIIAYK
jgi:hypothetical protein